MKSYCVLNSHLSAAAGESLGNATVRLLGRKIGVFCKDKSVAAAHLAKGIKKAGGCAVVFENCFESQLFCAVKHFCFDAVFYVGNKNLISVYSADGNPLSAAQEEKLSSLALENNPTRKKGGDIKTAVFDDVYYKYLLAFSQSFENVCVNIKSGENKPSAILKCALRALGGGNGSKPVFSISDSGLVLSAVDEKGRVYSHSVLYEACAACEIMSKNTVVLPLFLSDKLDKIAEKNKIRITRSFSGGSELWQKDAVFLAARLMYHMSDKGCGLSVLCDKISATAVSRKSFESTLSITDIADMIECEELIADVDCGVFARLSRGNVLLTSCSRAGRYCLEVQAANSEIAQELATEITKAACLT